MLLKSLEDLELPLVSPEAAAAFLIKLAMTSAASEAATPLGSFSTILLRYSRYTESNPPTLDEVAGVVISEDCLKEKMMILMKIILPLIQKSSVMKNYCILIGSLL